MEEEEEEEAVKKKKENETKAVKENKKLLTCNKLWIHSIVKWLRLSKPSSLI
jgi:hypothetical protein